MKAILVIDMPNACGECPLIHLEERWKCNLTDKIVSVDCEKPKPKWCPLKPLPQMKFYAGVNSDFVKGWKACLEEIEDD